MLYAAEAVLYLLFMSMDMTGLAGTAPIKYAGILLLAGSSLRFREKTVTLAMLLTAAADVFLLLLDRLHILGILCFTAVQLMYSVRMLRGKKMNAPYLLARVVPASAAGIASAVLLPLKAALAVFYIVWFAVNLAEAVKLALKCGRDGACSDAERKKWKLFALGMSLFFCCDICVGLHNIPGLAANIPGFASKAAEFAATAMWGFYIPGQVLIHASAGTAEKYSS